MAETGLQLRTEVKAGQLTVSLVDEPIPEPADDEVLVRVEASPINPSDLGLLLGPADLETASAAGDASHPAVTADIPQAFQRMTAAREGQSLPAGNEGAGTVVKAGGGELAQSLMGRTVAILGGAMYAQYRLIKAKQCLLMNEGVTAEQGASCFVNPLTALGMTETMRVEGHTALVHTAAASNLGQMLVKICLADGIELVNIVRRQEQVDLLQGLGAKHVCNSSSPTFMEDLISALDATNATIAFDATGGGSLAGQILTAMEIVQSRKAAGEFSRYGSTVHKQVYIYGGLETSPTTFNRAFGMAWGIGGWLLTPFLQKIGPAEADRLRQRVADEINTTFASHYTQRITLQQMLDVDVMKAYKKMATGEKYLVTPNG